MVHINTAKFTTAVAQIPTNIKYGCCKVASAISYVAHRALKGVASFFAAIRDFFFRPRPAAPRVIQLTPQAAPQQPQAASNCTICLEGANADVIRTEIIAARCAHLFHDHCLREWTSRNNSCPVCRAPEPLNYDYVNAPPAAAPRAVPRDMGPFYMRGRARPLEPFAGSPFSHGAPF